MNQMKFVLDENCKIIDDELPENIINAHDLFDQNGFKKHGTPDEILMELSNEHGYTIVTKDTRLIVKANSKRMDIVLAHGNRGEKWIFLSKKLSIGNRGVLKQLILNETNSNQSQSTAVISENIPKKKYIEIEIDCYEDGDIIFTNHVLGDNVYLVGFSVVGQEKALRLRKRLVKAKIKRVR